MDILIVCCKFDLIDRPTVRDHLFSFRRYGEKHRFFYLYIDSTKHISNTILQFPFDAVIFHHTFLAQRFGGTYFTRRYQEMLPCLKKLQGIKVMIPHDEYAYTQFLWNMAKDLSVDYIFTTYQEELHAAAFPRDQIGPSAVLYTVFPGYVEDRTEKKLRKKIARQKNRPLDVGYRAQIDQFVFGEHGHLKSEVARIFREYLSGESEIKSDIQLIEMDGANALRGRKWLHFLISSRTMLGCLGGSSLFDPTGCYRERTLRYMELHPNASYHEVEQACYPDVDWKVADCSLGPKNFEYAMTKTCQVLVEGWYHDVFHPMKHYIEIKKDFSNLSTVIQKIKDQTYCENIAQQCYEDIVLSGRYSYRVFVQFVLSTIQAKLPYKINRCRTSSYFKLRFVCAVQKVRQCFFLCLRLLKRSFSRRLKKIAPNRTIKGLYKNWLLNGHQ